MLRNKVSYFLSRNGIKLLFSSLFLFVLPSLFASTEGLTKMMAAKAPTIRIVCIGNSITQGKSSATNVTEPATFGKITDQLSYRFWLWQSLDSLGLDVDFVGTNKIWFNEVGSLAVPTPTSSYTGHTFPRGHESYYGITSGDFLNSISADGIQYPAFSARSKNFTADIALIHLGTNDNDADSVMTRNNIYTIIDHLRAQHDSIIIILAKTITNWKAVNKLVDKMCIAKTTSKSPVIAIDLATGFINDQNAAGTMTWDWVHPNPKGQKFMAKRWYDKILATLYVVTFTLKNSNGDKMPNAKIDFNNQTYYTNNQGVAVFKGILPNSRLDYTISLGGYAVENGNVNVVSNSNQNITLQATTDVDTPNNLDVQILPHSTSGEVVFKSNVKTHVNIYNVSGKKVYSFDLNKNTMTVDVSKYGKDIYLIKYQLNRQIFVKKLIIN